MNLDSLIGCTVYFGAVIVLADWMGRVKGTLGPRPVRTWHIRIPMCELDLLLLGPLKGAFDLYI